MASKRDLLLYGAAVLVVVAVVALAATGLHPDAYSVSIAMSNNRTGATFPYQTSIFDINVKNLGTSTISNLVVGFYLNGTELRHYTVTVPPRSNVTLQGNYTYTNSGSLYFQAIADPGRLLNVADRNGTKSGVLVDVLAPESPNVYKSVPNSNVTYTQSFAVSGTGIYSLSAIGEAYYLRVINGIFSPSKNIISEVFDNLYGYIAEVFGAYTEYANGTSTYIVWLQGTVNPGLVNFVVSSFRIPMSNATVNGTLVNFAQTGNQTSMCTTYVNGWTKVLVYYNNSLGGTCRSFMGREYQPTEGNSLVGALNASGNLTHYQSGFLYVNSTKLGSSLLYSNSSVGAMNIFQNSYGLFVAYVQKTSNAVDTDTNMSCHGITYSNGNVHTCSYILVPSDRSEVGGYGVVNTTEITANYTATLYSLVNASNLLPAHRNGVSLINALGMNSISALWVQSPVNACTFNSTALGCGINSFDYYNNTANLSVANKLGAQINVTAVGCHLQGVKYNIPMNQVIGGNSAASLKFPCYNMVGTPASVENYEITVNYTRDGANSVAIGTLNVTTAGFP